MVTAKPYSKFSPSRRPIVVRNAVHGVGDYVISQGCVMYEDPNNPGTFVADVNTQSQCGLPGDPGVSDALKQFAGDANSAANIAALNAQLTGNSAVSPTGSTSGNVYQGMGPGPISAPFNLPQIPSLFWIVALGIGALVLVSSKR